MTVYEIVTARIVEMLQQGTIPWRKPWRADAGEPRNLTSGKPYRGINVFLLLAMPFASPYWLTYRQATERGGSVRKGSKGAPVVFWRWNKPGAQGQGSEEQSGTDEQSDTSQRTSTRCPSRRASSTMARRPSTVRARTRSSRPARSSSIRPRSTTRSSFTS